MYFVPIEGTCLSQCVEGTAGGGFLAPISGRPLEIDTDAPPATAGNGNTSSKPSDTIPNYSRALLLDILQHSNAIEPPEFQAIQQRLLVAAIIESRVRLWRVGTQPSGKRLPHDLVHSVLDTFSPPAQSDPVDVELGSDRCGCVASRTRPLSTGPAGSRRELAFYGARPAAKLNLIPVPLSTVSEQMYSLTGTVPSLALSSTLRPRATEVGDSSCC
ncbi:hypothetical protein VUR80DRAFT_895 [Thermomyces stellatus]